MILFIDPDSNLLLCDWTFQQMYHLVSLFTLCGASSGFEMNSQSLVDEIYLLRFDSTTKQQKHTNNKQVEED